MSPGEGLRACLSGGKFVFGFARQPLARPLGELQRLAEGDSGDRRAVVAVEALKQRPLAHHRAIFRHGHFGHIEIKAVHPLDVALRSLQRPVPHREFAALEAAHPFDRFRLRNSANRRQLHASVVGHVKACPSVPREGQVAVTESSSMDESASRAERCVCMASSEANRDVGRLIVPEEWAGTNFSEKWLFIGVRRTAMAKFYGHSDCARGVQDFL